MPPETGSPLRFAIGATVVMGIGKLAAAVLTGSSAVAASAADSLSDAAISAMNLWMVRTAAQPADPGHPYGHGKAEGLAALAQGAFLAGVVGWIAWNAVSRLLVGGGAAPLAGPALVAMALSLAGSLAISRVLASAARKTGSLVLKADAVHYTMDLWTGGAVVLGLVATLVWESGAADAVASLAVCAIMGREVVRILEEAVGELMDRAFDFGEQEQVLAAMRGFGDRLSGWHDLRTRRAGPLRFVQVHIELPGDLTLRAAHEVAEEVEEALRTAVPGCDVTVHVDPAG